jgi:hypothetical protein
MRRNGKGNKLNNTVEIAKTLKFYTFIKKSFFTKLKSFDNEKFSVPGLYLPSHGNHFLQEKRCKCKL